MTPSPNPTDTERLAAIADLGKAIAIRKRLLADAIANVTQSEAVIQSRIKRQRSEIGRLQQKRRRLLARIGGRDG